MNSQSFNAQFTLPTRSTAPVVLAITREPAVGAMLAAAAERLRFDPIVATPEALPDLDPEQITVAIVDDRVITRRTPLNWLIEWVAVHGGVDAVMIRGVADASDPTADGLTDQFDDIVHVSEPEDLLRAIVRGQRLAGERRAARFSNLAGRAALHALDESPEYVTLLDRQGRRIWSTPAMGRDFDIDVSALVGTDYLTIHRRTPSAHLAIARLYNTAMANPGKLVQTTVDAVRPNGDAYYYEARMINLLEDPEVGVTVVMTREIGKVRRLTGEQPAEGATSFRTMIEHGPLVTFVNAVSPAERIIYASPQAERLLRVPVGAFTDPAFDWLEHVHPDDRERVERESALADAGLGEIAIDYRYLQGDGSYRWMRSISCLARNETGEEIWIGNFVDIDDDRRARETAERHDAEMHLLHDLRRLIAQEDQLGAIFERAVATFARASSFPMIRLYTLEDDLPALVAAKSSGDEQDLHPDHRLLISRAIRSGVTAMAGPVTADGSSLVAPGTVPSHLTAEIAVPLIDRDRVMGVLVVGGTRGQPIQPADIALAETVAEYLSMAAARTRLQDEARQHGLTYQTVVERVRDVIFHLSSNLEIVYVNPAWNATLGYPVDKQIGVSLLDVIHPGDRDRIESLLDGLGDVESGMVATETQVLTNDGSARWMELRALTDSRQTGQADITGMLFDITDRHHSDEALRESNERFRELAFKDLLTGLPNRLVFHDRLQHALAFGGRRGTGVAVLFLDLDGFKPVNDLYGHAAGDRVLQIVAERLQERMRSVDTIARFGGDEFAVILEDLVDVSQAMSIGAGLIDAMQAPIQVGAEMLTVGLSLGITFLGGRVISTEEAVAEADAALYEAKSGGRGRYALFERPDEAEGGERHRSDLRRGITSSEITMIYHPIFAMADRRVIAIEARIRWDHPSYGRLIPGHFLRRSDASGLLDELGEEVITLLARDVGLWLEHGIAIPQLRITLSGRQALDADLPRLMTVARERYGMPGSAFGVELSDGSSSAERAAIEQMLTELRAIGVTIGYENFGGGSSTLPALARMQLDFVNVNVDFAPDPDDRAQATAMMRATRNLANDLGWTLIAKEVNTPGLLTWITDLGLPYAQGDALHPAAPAEKLVGLLKGE